jgi:hypothetical protein
MKIKRMYILKLILSYFNFIPSINCLVRKNQISSNNQLINTGEKVLKSGKKVRFSTDNVKEGRSLQDLERKQIENKAYNESINNIFLKTHYIILVFFFT